MAKFIQNFGGFFSDYYLGELLEKKHKGNLGENTRLKAFSRLKGKWDLAYRILGEGSKKGETRQKWLTPLFEELGFDLQPGKEIETEKETLKSSHMLIDGNGKTPFLFVDLLAWDRDLDSFAPGEGRNNTSHKKMERLLVAGNVHWGIISNGQIIRLLRQEQGAAGRAYLQVDLENIFAQEDQQSFDIFWALFRKESYVKGRDGKCLLDKIDEESRSHASKVSGHLKNSVFRALELLVQGLIDEPKNKAVLDPIKDLYEVFRQSLIYLYRMLFILYAESMELLPIDHHIYRDNYSIESLRELIESPNEIFHPNEYRLWDSLKAVFTLVNNGVKAGDFYITAYNGKLFSPENALFLDKCKVSDSLMKEILLNLSTTDPQRHRGRDRISYRELGVEQLGAVYEGMLEYEPKIATEEMAVIKIGKEQQVIAKSLAQDARIVEIIPRGKFYLALWGGRRKGTGSYYTPKPITGFLVERALNPLIEGKNSEELLNIKIIDPAMGSGAFLVSACHYLADAYGRTRISEGLDEDGKLDEYERVQYRRLVAERCLYGVDLNPMAVELAKLSLWLTTLAEDRPLTFLDHHLRCGNSLIGAEFKDVFDFKTAHWLKKSKSKRKKSIKDEAQFALFEEKEFEQNIDALVKHRNWLATELSDTIDRIHKKERLLEEDQREGSFYSKLKLLYNLWCSCWFWPDGTLPVPNENIFRDLRGYIFKGEYKLPEETCEKYINVVKEIAKEQRFFHWELEYPEVYRDEEGKLKQKPGFNMAIGNPPWNIIKPNSQEFFSNYDSKFRSYKKQKAKEVIENLCKTEMIKKEWERYKRNFRKQSDFFRISNKYPNLGRGDINSFKLFLEQFFNLVNTGGQISIIIPSGIHTDAGCMNMRELFFDSTKIRYLYGFENRMKLFPIDSRFKFDLLEAMKGSKTEFFKAGFMLHNPEILPRLEQDALNLPLDLIRRFSPDTLSIMEFKSQREINTVNKIYALNPFLGQYLEDTWNITFGNELHMTKYSSLLIPIEKIIDIDLLNSEYLLLYEGKTIHHFTHKFSKPRYCVEEKLWVGEIGKNRGRSFDYNKYRIAIRYQASSTNERTLISTIIPKNLLCGHSLIVNRVSSNIRLREMVFLSALLNSFCQDYVLRLKVSANINIYHIEQLALPRLSNGNWYFDEIIIRTTKLICITEEFAELWQEVMEAKWMPESSVTDEKERMQLRAEIDALVAHLYGLNKDEFEYILSTFPLVKQEIKDKTLEEFIKLEKSIPSNAKIKQ